MNTLSTLRSDNCPPYSDWLYALQGTPEKQQIAILAVLDVYRRLQHIPLRATDAAMAEKQLEWWQQQCTELSQTTHPTLQILAAINDNDNVQLRLQRLVQLTREDLHFAGFVQHNDMRVFFRTRGALLMELLALTGNAKLPTETAADLGYVFEFHQYLQQLSHYSSLGLIYFAQETRLSAGFTSDEAFLDNKNATANPAWLRLLNETSEACLSLYQQKKNTLSRLPTLRFLLRYVELQKAWLLATRHAHFPLYHYRIQLGSLQRRWICLRTNLMTLLP